MPSPLRSLRGRRRPVRSPVVNAKPTSGCAIASRLTTSDTAMFSERSDFRNLRRAGVAENRSRTSTREPAIQRRRSDRLLAAAIDDDFEAVACAVLARGDRQVADRADRRERLAAKPERSGCRAGRRLAVSMWRGARRRDRGWSRSIPWPSSVTRMSDRPPAAVTMSISRAPASMAFSTSSLTTLAGRSITSPAAMRLTVSAGSWRMCAVISDTELLAPGVARFGASGGGGWPVCPKHCGSFRIRGSGVRPRSDPIWQR